MSKPRFSRARNHLKVSTNHSAHYKSEKSKMAAMATKTKKKSISLIVDKTMIVVPRPIFSRARNHFKVPTDHSANQKSQKS